MDIINFIIAATVLTLIPGPDLIFVLTQSVASGRKSGIYTALGLAFGNLFHTSLVCLGISALIISYPFAFISIKYIGALYLLYLSLEAYLNRNKILFANENESDIKSKKKFLKGLLMNVFNPKVSLFFIAFLPQFMSKNSNNPSLELLILGLIFITIVMICFSSIAILANYLHSILHRYKDIDKIINILKSIVFMILAFSIIIT
jgi:threonine/homoserine/homoserine lactone efflux protein